MVINRDRHRTDIVTVALAVFALLLQAVLPSPSLHMAAVADAALFDAHALCLSPTGNDAGSPAPPGKAPGSHSQSCAACCCGPGSVGMALLPDRIPDRIIFAAPRISFQAPIAVAKPHFAHAVRARAPPARAI